MLSAVCVLFFFFNTPPETLLYCMYREYVWLKTRGGSGAWVKIPGLMSRPNYVSGPLALLSDSYRTTKATCVSGKREVPRKVKGPQNIGAF